MVIPLIVQAAIITTCTLDKSVYNRGETGFITVTIYNDKDDKIRVSELTAAIDYYYDDGNSYLQTFFSSADLPIEIQQGQSEDFLIPFSLPNNIAHGYTELLVKAKTDLWNNNSQIWFMSDHPTYQPVLYIESPYKQQFENQQAINDQLQQQIQELQQQISELQAVNNTNTTMMYIFGSITVAFALMTVFLMILNRRSKGITQPAV